MDRNKVKLNEGSNALNGSQAYATAEEFEPIMAQVQKVGLSVLYAVPFLS